MSATQNSENHEQRLTRVEVEVGSLANSVQALVTIQEKAEQRADSRHRETQESFKKISDATTSAVIDLNKKISQSREGKPEQTRWAVGMAWAVSVVVVGWAASVSSKGNVTAASVDTLSSGLTRLETIVHEHQRDGHPNRVEAKAVRNANDIETLDARLREIESGRFTDEDGRDVRADIADLRADVARIEGGKEHHDDR